MRAHPDRSLLPRALAARAHRQRGAGVCGLAAALLACLTPGVLAASDTNAAAGVVVLANRNVPESLALARHYIRARGIPPGRLCALDLPDEEALSRRDYNLRLRDPLLLFLRERGLVEQEARDPEEVRPNETAWSTSKSSVRCLVSMYGVPLRIADTRTDLGEKIAARLGGSENRNSAAVDSELALLLMPSYDIEGPRGSTMFLRTGPPGEGSDGEFLLMAARLDGPSPAVVRRMIDEALIAERYGLLGRAVFDGRGLSASPYALGDYWIEEACERFRREGYECVLDRSEGLWGQVVPWDDVVLYFGWYSEHAAGLFTRADFRFRPGAIAYHIHSASAATLHSDSEYWAGPLLARGAAATMGATGEPFLFFTPHLQVFADRICRGHTFGESAYMSLQSVSWQITVVGDPLFQPFRYSLEEQIRHLEQDGRPDVGWAYLRKVNLLVREGRFNLGLDFCRAALAKSGSLVLAEKLGDLYALNHLYDDAGRQYEQILQSTESAAQAIRVGATWLRILRALGQEERAAGVETELRSKWQDSGFLPWLETARP